MREEESLATIIEKIIQRIDYHSFLKKTYDPKDANSKIENIDEIDELSDIKQNNALILIQQLVMQAFSEIMLINKIRKDTKINILL